ncbi:MAG: hypothetical protein ACKVX9_12515 [Blastocatellia bacterium]
MGGRFPRGGAEAQGVLTCQTALCYRMPHYFLLNYKRLRLFPRDIFISGVNLNHPVDCVAQPTTVMFALRGGLFGSSRSPLTQFNQHYVAAQLSQALIPYLMVRSASATSLGCYGLEFAPERLSNGFLITPATTVEELFTQCDLTGIQPMSEARDADMLKLARILSMLNGTC